MPENRLFLPEGLGPSPTYALSDLKTALENGEILEAAARRCDPDHTLRFTLGSVDARMPRQEAIAPWISGADRDIAVLSRVGKETCFTVKAIGADEKGAPTALLSRREAQEKAMDYFLGNLEPGMVLACRVVRLETYGAFLDIGCGVVAILPIEQISVSRIQHPRERFQEGQKVLAAVLSFDKERKRITMTHRELLGTWMENASRFAPGEAVEGVVRGVKEYGSFIELTPNLSGLADAKGDLAPGDRVSVYIKSIRPERMKIKLQVIQKLPPAKLEPIRYQITDGQLDRWVYSPPGYEKEPVETVFLTAPCP